MRATKHKPREKRNVYSIFNAGCRKGTGNGCPRRCAQGHRLAGADPAVLDHCRCRGRRCPSVLVPYVSFEDQPGFVAEGTPIPESDPEDTQVQIFTGKVAILVPVSREQMGQPDASALLSSAAREAVIRKANRAFLTQAAPVAPAATPRGNPDGRHRRGR